MSSNNVNQLDTFITRAEPPPFYLTPFSKKERGGYEKETLNRLKD